VLLAHPMPHPTCQVSCSRRVIGRGQCRCAATRVTLRRVSLLTYVTAYLLTWQVLSYYGHPSPWGPEGLHNASLRSGFVNGNRVWCSRMSDRLQAYLHMLTVATLTVDTLSMATIPAPAGRGVGGVAAILSLAASRLQSYAFRLQPYVYPGCNPMHPGCNPMCTQAATLCTRAATLCIQAEEWEDPWLSTMAPPGLGRTVPRPYDRGLFPVRCAHCMTTLIP